MKAPGKFGWVAAVLFIFLGGLADASPNRLVRVKERLLGTDGTAYAVLRTEFDNCGSYLERNTKVYFIERFPDGSTPEKSTLLSEIQSNLDGTHNNPNVLPTTRVVTRDDNLSLTEALLRYPLSEAETWDATKLARLSSDPASGISLDGRVRVASGPEIEELFSGPSEKDQWKISEAFEQGGCVFLSLEMAMTEDGPQTRLLGLGRNLSDQVNAHLEKEDIYLSAGSFGTREEALERVKAWKADEKMQVTYLKWEVWSRRLPTDKTDYVLVLAGTREMLEGERSKRIEEKIGIKFEAVSSERFIERTRVP